MRRLLLSAVTIAAAGVPLLTVTDAPASTSPAFSISGHTAGGVKAVSPGDPITFVFKETNRGSQMAGEDLVLVSLTSANATSISCVLPGGGLFNPDGTFCEPGFIKPGQSSSMVIDAQVTAAAARVSARVCLESEATGKVGPCTTVSVRNYG